MLSLDMGSVIVFILCFLAAAPPRTSARCPDLEPPDRGVLKCQALDTQMQCTATCYKGYLFSDGGSVVQRTCVSGSASWTEGGPSLPACVRECDHSLMEETDRELQVSSSLYPQHLYGGHAAMLSVNGSWRPEWDNILQFIQVDLGSDHVIKGWRVRGDGEESYVRMFRLLFSQDGDIWTPYSDGRITDKFFTGSFDSRTTVTEMLERPQVARYVRVNPLSWHQHIALDWDLIGCPYDAPPVGQPVTEQPECKLPEPPERGAVNCERNGAHTVCTAYCQPGLVFSDLDPTIDLTCDPSQGLFSNTPLPACVERDSTPSSVNISGPCIQSEGDCAVADNGDYQYCEDCHYFSTCSHGYFYVRPCPEQLQFDSSHGRCDYHSSTCSKDKRRWQHARLLSNQSDGVMQHVRPDGNQSEGESGKVAAE